MLFASFLSGLFIGFESGGEWGEGAFEEAEAVCDDEAIVGDWDAGPAALEDAREHLPAVEHTGAAVDDEFVLGDVVGPFAAGQGGEVEFAADVLGEPSRDFYPADVFADGVMRAGLGDKDFVARLERIDGHRAERMGDEVAFEAGE